MICSYIMANRERSRVVSDVAKQLIQVCRSCMSIHIRILSIQFAVFPGRSLSGLFLIIFDHFGLGFLVTSTSNETDRGPLFQI